MLVSKFLSVFVSATAFLSAFAKASVLQLVPALLLMSLMAMMSTTEFVTTWQFAMALLTPFRLPTATVSGFVSLFALVSPSAFPSVTEFA